MNQGMQQKMLAGAVMQQSMRILQANSMELQAIVSQALVSNPTLEERPLPPREDGQQDTPESDTRDSQYWMEQLSSEPSLREHLREQIHQEELSDELLAACLVLVDSLDSRGYLDEDIDELSREMGASAELYGRALQQIQQLEPAGVGARDLRECLLLQLGQLDEAESLAATLLREHWSLLVEHHYEQAAAILHVDEQSVRAAALRIARLQPHPASAFARLDESIILPDVEVHEDESAELSVSLTGEYIPQLALNADYRSMMAQQAENRELRDYLSRCFREARDLISAIEQRQASLLHVTRAIVVHQREFFQRGAAFIKPLKMEQIAHDTQLHLSTVSRAVRGKYLRCRQGLFELRHFFQRGVGEGEQSQSISRVYAQLREWIELEDKSSPLSDSALVSLFADKGIIIARRTLAKYREQLGIPAAAQRRK